MDTTTNQNDINPWLLQVDFGAGGAAVSIAPPPIAIGDVSSIVAATQPAASNAAAAGYSGGGNPGGATTAAIVSDDSPATETSQPNQQNSRPSSNASRPSNSNTPELPLSSTNDTYAAPYDQTMLDRMFSMPKQHGWNFSVAGGYNSDLLARGVSMIGKNTFNDTAREIFDNWSSVSNADLFEAGLLSNLVDPKPASPSFAKPNEGNTDISIMSFAASKDRWNLGFQYVRSLSSDLVPFWQSSMDQTDAYEEFRVSASYTHPLLPDNWLNGSTSLAMVYYPNDSFWGVSHQGLFTAGLSVDRFKYYRPYITAFYNIPTDNSYAADLPRLNAEGGDLIEGYGATLGVQGKYSLASMDNSLMPQVDLAIVYDANVTAKFGYFSEQEGLTNGMVSLSLPVTIASRFTISPTAQYVFTLQDISPSVRGFVNRAYGSDFNEPGFIWSLNASYSF